MCGRFALVTTISKVKAQFHVDDLPEILPRYNIAPSQDVLFLMQSEDVIQGVMLTWGLVPFFAKSKKISPPLTNARAETVAVKPAFRHGFKSKRGLMLMSGFYEWKTSPEGTKQPYYISSTEDQLFAVAGLWETWQSPEGESVHSCCLITTEANELMLPIHQRMPVLLNPDQQKIWLDTKHFDAAELNVLLKPYPGQDIKAYPVSSRMNNWRYQDPDCIQPI